MAQPKPQRWAPIKPFNKKIRLCPVCGAKTGPCQKWLKGQGYYVDMKSEHEGRPPK
jgi:hypothetical protein